MNKVISIGRQLGSGGRTIAKLVADHFGCQFYDSELLNLAAKESGFSEQAFKQNDERRRFFRNFGAITSMLTPHSSLPTPNNDFSPEGLFKFQSDAIQKAADEGDCVFVGRCADYILRELPQLVTVFITADIDYRAEQVAKREGCDAEEALRIIHDKESQRAAYYNYYTGKRWGDSSSYQLCINSSLFGLERTAEYIEQFVEERLALVGKE